MKLTKSYIKSIIMEELARLDEVDIETFQRQEDARRFAGITDPKILANLRAKFNRYARMKAQSVPDTQIRDDMANLTDQEADAISKDPLPDDKPVVDLVRNRTRTIRR